ncbi:MAG: NAD-dependent epimerase/dehydratase family protein [Candidatus Hydrogenedens sp.]|nr:NAD-dependent epimerase/dehydratase family protein [Candidatus Hydrogenedentota bacterium]NLF59389.1 NAD-dependent epimerase/dehydratase family protein [Candidatus Hydrogenedens sp.]
MANVLIAGCGYVGCALGLLLAGRGHAVWALRRRPEGLPPVLRPLAGDLTRPDGVTLPNAPLDLVFYTAAADGMTPESYDAAYVRGPENLMAALVRSGQHPSRIFFTSSTGVYHQNEGEWVDEDSPTLPARFSGRALLAGEKVFRDAPFPATVTRLGGIYGPGRTRLVDGVRAGTMAAVRGDKSILNLVHRDDCAGGLAFLAGLDTPESLYCLVDEEPVEKNLLLSWIAGELGVSLAEKDGDSGLPEPVRGGFRRVSGGRIRSAGYVFRYPTYREGYGALLKNGGAGGQ